MNTTTVEQLRTLYVKMGGKLADVAEIQTDAEMIGKIEDVAGISNPKVLVLPEAQSSTLYGESVSNMQTADTSVIGNAIVGTVKKLTSGELPDYWGAGNFLALKFISVDPDITFDKISVGIKNRVTLDEDMNCAFFIEDKTKPLHVCVTIDGVEYDYKYNLNGLILQD